MDEGTERIFVVTEQRCSVILDRETVALGSVYTPLTVIEQEPDEVKPGEETTIKEIEFLRKMTREKSFGGFDYNNKLE